MTKYDPVEFCGEMRHETDGAYCVFDGSQEVWIPKSQCQEVRRIGGKLSADHVFVIPEWLAIVKGII